MLGFSEILKSQMSKKKRKHKKRKGIILEKLLDILLIIISVYIALFVESWSENRKDHERLHNYYKSFVNEINQDIADLKNENADAELKVKQSDLLLDMFKTGEKNDSIKYMFRPLLSSSFFSSSKTASYKSMVASGDLKLIEKLEIRQLLVALEGSYQAVKIEEDLYFNFLTVDLQKYLLNNFDLQRFKPNDPAFYLKSTFKNLIVLDKGYNLARIMKYKNALQTAGETLKKIKEELKEMEE